MKEIAWKFSLRLVEGNEYFLGQLMDDLARYHRQIILPLVTPASE